MQWYTVSKELAADNTQFAIFLDGFEDTGSSLLGEMPQTYIE